MSLLFTQRLSSIYLSIYIHKVTLKRFSLSFFLTLLIYWGMRIPQRLKEKKVILLYFDNTLL